jgi:hypothetical protein
MSSISPIDCGEDALEFKLDKVQICPVGKWPALRRYDAVTSSFDYMAVVYNAKVDESQKSHLEFQHAILKDGKVIYQGDPSEIHSTLLEGVGGTLIKNKVDLKKWIREPIFFF